ncbi:MAG TPA: hypothetical protein VGM88_24445 [Kofleriaceae bacterium]|jgi:hypothetical protein
MRLALAVIALSSYTACTTDPELDVVVHHPLTVASTTVTVYESASLSCDDIEFDTLSADQLATIAVTSASIDAAGDASGELTGMSRTDPKIVVARGYDGSGALIAVGCVAYGVIDGRASVEVDTNIAATPSVGLAGVGADDPFGVAILATDPDGVAIPDRPMSWTVYGPAGSMPYDATHTTPVDDGVWRAAAPLCPTGAMVHPMPPALVGGFAMQLRVAWATGLPPLLSLLTGIDDDTLMADFLGFAQPSSKSTHYCALRASGTTHRLVCLKLNLNLVSTTATDYAVTAANGGATLHSMGTASGEPGNPAAGEQAFGVITLPVGTDRDAFSVTNTGRLVGQFGAPVVRDPTGLPGAGNADDAWVAPACDDAPVKVFLRWTTGAQSTVYVASWPADPTLTALAYTEYAWAGGEAVAASGAPHFNAAGCVTQLAEDGGSASTKQVVAMDVNFGDVPLETHASYDCTSSAHCPTQQLITGTAVGFVGGGGGNQAANEARAVITTVDATGVIVEQLVFAPISATTVDHFVQRTRAPAAGAPVHMVSGQFDGDGLPDLVFSMSKRSASFEIAYAREIEGQPLEALTASKPFDVDDLLAADLTGDGVDDLVITGEATTLSALAGVLVVPLQSPLGPFDPMVDATCP